MLDLLHNSVQNDQNNEVDLIPLMNYVSLYFRCRRFKDFQLPLDGGILDQEEITMQIFEVIHEVVLQYEKEQQEEEMSRMQQQMRVANAKQSGKRGFGR